jgi:hypothetical protein
VPRTRLRTRFLLSMVLITFGLTALSLLVVRHSVQTHVREGIAQDLRNSVTTFQNFQHDREGMLTHSAELVAYLPITRAIMTPHDPATIQDASKDLWPLTGSDLLVLAERGRLQPLVVWCSPSLPDFCTTDLLRLQDRRVIAWILGYRL